jgi:hypothetical protein
MLSASRTYTSDEIFGNDEISNFFCIIPLCPKTGFISEIDKKEIISKKYLYIYVKFIFAPLQNYPILINYNCIVQKLYHLLYRNKLNE